MNDTSRKHLYRFLLLILFAVLFFALRIPLLSEPLGFEEGIFADLIVNRPNGPAYELNGRIDGDNIYTFISHPAVPYEMLRLGGFLAKDFLNKNVYLNDALITPRLRLICSMYQFICWEGLLVLILWNRRLKGLWPILVLFVVMMSPLSIKTSTHLQIDNTAGVLLCGTAALLFLMADSFTLSVTKKNILLFTGGFAAGLGKQEWSFALLAGLGILAIAGAFMNYEGNRRERMNYLFSISAGLLLSNLASYLYDPDNYVRGLFCIVYFSQLHETSAGDWNLAHWLQMMKLRLPYIYVCFILLLPIAYALIKNRNRHFLYDLGALYGLCLLGGYLLSDWNYQARYFCPALAVLTVCAIFLVPTRLPRCYYRITLAGLMSVLVTTVIFLHGYRPDRNLHLEQIKNGTLKSSANTALYIQSGAGWNKPDLNYLNNNSPFDYTKKNVQEKYRKKLIRPEDMLQEQD